MNPPIDLRQLAVRREVAPPGRTSSRRQLFTRYLLPALLLLGFVAVLGWTISDSFLPARSVTVVPVLATRATLVQTGTPVCQAAGWIEPRPTPTVVTALAEGVVKELLVVEGQAVAAGDPVARLIDTDVRLALQVAEAEVHLREAELAVARAARDAAQTNLQQPVHLEAARAEADALLARAETELANLPFQLRAAEARKRLAQVDWENKTAVPGAVPALTVVQARSELDTATATVEELTNRQPRLEHEIGRASCRERV